MHGHGLDGYTYVGATTYYAIHAWQRGRVCLCLTNDSIVGEHMSGKVSALLMRHCTNRWAGKTGLSGWVRGGLIEHDLCTK